MPRTAQTTSRPDFPVIVSGCFRKIASVRFVCSEYDQLSEYCRACDDATRVYMVSDPTSLMMTADGSSRAGFFYSREAMFNLAHAMHGSFASALRQLAVTGRSFAGTDAISKVFNAFLSAKGDVLDGAALLTTVVPDRDYLTVANCTLPSGTYGEPHFRVLDLATRAAERSNFGFLAGECAPAQFTCWYVYGDNSQRGGNKRGVVIWSRRGEVPQVRIAPCLVCSSGTWTLQPLAPVNLSATSFDPDWADQFDKAYREAENKLRRLRQLPLSGNPPSYYHRNALSVFKNAFWLDKAINDALFRDSVPRDEVTASGNCDRLVFSMLRALRVLDLRIRLQLEPMIGDFVSRLLEGERNVTEAD